MNINFDSITGVEDYEIVKKTKWERLEEKYQRAGVYCIKLNNKILYIGKSINMLTRIHQHKKEIKEKNHSEKKYKILADARLDGLNIQFDVLYYCPFEDKQEQNKDLKEKEAYYINFFLPPLNKQIPEHKDFIKQTTLLPIVDNYKKAIELVNMRENT